MAKCRDPESCRSALASAMLSVMSSVLLVACGGGGDSANAAPAPAASPAPAPTNLPSSATCSLPDFANSALARVNQWRARGATCGSFGSFGAAPALAWNNALTQAATAHSNDMVANNFFDHTGSNGSKLDNRIDATGYAWSSIGENIAAGPTSVNEVVDGWIASPGHCANIMSPTFVHIGLACVRGTAGNAYPTYWTMDLARPR